MCWAAVAAVATVIGTAVSAYGQYQSGRAQAGAASYNAAVANNQAIATQQLAQQQADAQRREAETQAAAATAQAGSDEAIARDRFRRLQAAARASLGVSGQTGEGSATDLLAENASAAELDALTIRYGGAARADAIRRGANLGADALVQQAGLNAGALNSQANLFRFQGSQAAFGGYLGAGTSLLTGAGQFARNFNWSNGGLQFRGT